MMMCGYEVGARSGFIRKAEIFASNFSALENDLNTLPRNLGKFTHWCDIVSQKVRILKNFLLQFEPPMKRRMCTGPMDINNVGMCELYSSGSSQGQIPDLCEHGNKNSVSLKVRNFFTSRSNFTFLNVTQHGV